MMGSTSFIGSKPFASVGCSRKFIVPARLTIAKRARNPSVNAVKADGESSSLQPFNSTSLLAAAGLLTPLICDVESALAQKGEYGIVEGRIASLAHPALMGFLFVSSLYTAWLGFQWR